MPPRTIPTDELPVGATIGHFVLRTADLDATIAFYERLVGMRVRTRDDNGAALWNDDEHHRIALMAVGAGAAPGMQDPGFEHIAFKLRNLGDLLGAHRRMTAAGTPPFAAIHHGGSISAYFLDPSGIQVEAFVDTHALHVCAEWLTSDAFAENPVGVPVDLDDLAVRYEAGEDLTTLLAQPELREGQMESLLATLFGVRSSGAA